MLTTGIINFNLYSCKFPQRWLFEGLNLNSLLGHQDLENGYTADFITKYANKFLQEQVTCRICFMTKFSIYHRFPY